MLSLEKILNIEMVWFSFSTSRLEIDANLKSLVENAVNDAIALNLDSNIPAEKIWWDLLQFGRAFHRVVSLIEVDPNEAKKTVIGSDYFATIILPCLMDFLSTYDKVKTNNFVLPQSFQVHQREIMSAVHDHESYVSLYHFISDPHNFCVGMKELNDKVQYIDLVPIDSTTEKNLGDYFLSLEQLSPHSLICSIVKDNAIMHVHLRKAIIQQDWWNAKIQSSTIIKEDTLKISWIEASMVGEFLSIYLSCRQLEQGLLCCIFPPVIGWSGYSTATSF
jgi:hypothetical protein